MIIKSDSNKQAFLKNGYKVETRKIYKSPLPPLCEREERSLLITKGGREGFVGISVHTIMKPMITI
jgi:hypothetical protein